MKEYFKIGEISRLYGIGVDTLRYYEKIGALTPLRSESGYRYYSIRDIWKLNIIRDLRGLGFGMEQIRQYLDDHSVESTLELLQQEQKAIREQITRLQALQKNVEQRLQTIQTARERELDVIRLETIGDRRCSCIRQGYSDAHEMDVLMKRLMNQDRLSVIGSNQIGSTMSLPEAAAGKIRYEAVFVVDETGGECLPGGSYLTVTYRGGYEKSGPWGQKLLAWAAEHGMEPAGELLEILHIDIHTSADVREHITELQLRCRKPE